MPSGSESRGPDKNSGAKSAKAIKAANEESAARRESKGGAPQPRQHPLADDRRRCSPCLALDRRCSRSTWSPSTRTRPKPQKFAPSAENQDPSTTSTASSRTTTRPACTSSRRSAWPTTRRPPFGGPHDATWATCTGVGLPERDPHRERGALARARRRLDRLQPGQGQRRPGRDARRPRSTASRTR